MKNPWVILAFVVLAVVLLFHWLPAVQMESKAKRSKESIKLHQIGCALHNYHDIHNSFPPAIVYNEKGEKLYSWRVLLLPYLVSGEDELAQRNDDWARSSDLWDYFERRQATQETRRIDDQIRKIIAEFDLHQAWDSPANRHLSEMNFDFYRRPNSGNGSTTDYFAITGPDTAWPLDRPTRFGSFKDGCSNSIMIVEGGDVEDICWAEPRDLEYEKLSFKINGPDRPGIFGNSSYGAHTALADGSTDLLPKTIDPETLKSLLLINDSMKSGP